MTKTIISIVQNDSGGTNPDTHAHEDKIWELKFEDDEIITLTRMKMMEFLTKGTVPTKTVHSFKKWELTTTQGNNIRTWVIVYDDKSHVQLTNVDFYSLLTNGHKNRGEDEHKEPDKEHKAPVNPILFEGRKSLTTSQEQEELDLFRDSVLRENFSPSYAREKKEENIAE